MSDREKRMDAFSAVVCLFLELSPCVRIDVVCRRRSQTLGGSPQGGDFGGIGVIEMGSYRDNFKETMVQKMTGPDAKSATALAEEVDVPQSTLSRWLKDYGRFGSTGDEMSTKKRPQNWTAQEKMQAVVTCEGMDEQQRGVYLRGHGLYSVDMERWHEEMLQALSKKPKKRDPKDRRIRELEGELRRKEKALAETAALLVLKKKAQAIWGDSEDEK